MIHTLLSCAHLHPPSQKGSIFLHKAQQGRERIAPKGLPFIRDGAVRRIQPSCHHLALLSPFFMSVNINSSNDHCLNDTPHYNPKTVLTLARSRVVLAVLLAAARANKRFDVIVTESRPSCAG